MLSIRWPILLLVFTISCRESEQEMTIASDTLTNSTTTVTRDTENASTPTRPDSHQTILPPTDTLQRVRLLPVDEASKDPTFITFRSNLLKVIAQKNTPSLMEAIDSNIFLSFGGDRGHQDFHRLWKPVDTESPVWKELKWILEHGGAFKTQQGKRRFWAPYVYSNWPEGGTAPDPFEHVAITSANIPLKSSADERSVTITELTYDIVSVKGGAALKERKPQWLKVKTIAGNEGFVRSTYARSPLDYRAGFEKRGATWKIVVLIAGD